MKICLGVSVPNNGLDQLSFLAHCALELSSGKHDIEIHATCHEKPETLEPIAAVVHVVPRYENTHFHSNSRTHSDCINRLWKSMDGDVNVILDYDTAFVVQGWDQILVDKLSNLDAIGSPYSDRFAIEFRRGAVNFLAAKYQGIPNAIFFAYTASLRQTSPIVCDFATKYDNNAYPYEFINTLEMALTYNLPNGSMRHVDTGNLIPKILHGRAYEVFERRAINYRVIQKPHEANWTLNLEPEEYWLDGEPFVLHFRKSGSKTKEITDEMQYDYESFKRDVRAYIGV